MSEKTPDTPQGEGKFVKIEWPEADVASYANNLIATSDANATYLTFFQVPPPIIWGVTEEEKQEQLKRLSSVKARPVARVVVPIETLPGMIEVLQKQLTLIENFKRHGLTAT